MHAVVSVDGFIADAEDNVGPLFEWYFNGDVEIVDGGPFKVSRDSARYVRSAVRTVQQCETRGLAESLPVLSDCVIDPSLAPSSLAAMRPRAHVAGECCGADHACGTGDDDALAAIGWTSPACPNLANGVCDNPIASPDDPYRPLNGPAIGDLMNLFSFRDAHKGT